MPSRRTWSAIVAVLAIALGAAACYPPSQTPTTQPIPAGGKVVATAPALTELAIEDASPDLSTILFRRNDFLINVGDPIPYRFWVWDEARGTTTEVPVGRAEFGTARLSPDHRKVVFSSNDSRIQVGPTAVNCSRWLDPWGSSIAPQMCHELYVFDLDTGVRTQLTGLSGSSRADNINPMFTPDQQGIIFQGLGPPGGPNEVWGWHRLDLATGQLDVASAPIRPTSWDRGTNVVDWNAATGTLTSTDTATGDVTTLWADPTAYYLESWAGNGRFIVVSNWVNDSTLVYRLIDTDTRSIRVVRTPWISDDGSRQAIVQVNVSPDAIDRLVVAPLPH